MHLIRKFSVRGGCGLLRAFLEYPRSLARHCHVSHGLHSYWLLFGSVVAQPFGLRTRISHRQPFAARTSGDYVDGDFAAVLNSSPICFPALATISKIFALLRTESPSSFQGSMFG